MAIPKKLPKRFYKYFWDTDPGKVSPVKNPVYVISRMLDKGGIDAVRWVLRTFNKSVIKKTFQVVSDFSPRIGNFWQMMLNIPKGEVACLKPRYQKTRKMLWGY